MIKLPNQVDLWLAIPTTVVIREKKLRLFWKRPQSRMERHAQEQASKRMVRQALNQHCYGEEA